MTAKSTNLKGRRNLLTKLSDDVVRAARKSFGASAVPNANVAALIGKEVALNISDYWTKAQQAPVGPIDVIDIFSGCGGMSAGFRAVNGFVPAFNLAMALDIAPSANATYEHNLGVTPKHVDVSTLARDPKLLKALIRESKRRKGHPLILIGCAPCQGFSSHRNDEGNGDVRNSLFVDFARIASSIKPDAVIIENVPELLTNKYWPFVEEAKAIFMAAGYSIYIGVHNMAEFGVPQERFRAVMLALPHAFQPPHGFLERSSFRTVRQSIGKLRTVKAGELDRLDAMHYSAGHKKSTLDTIRAVPKDGGNRPPDVGPSCLRRGKEKAGKAIYEDVYGRLFWDKPAITITAYARNPASGRFIHPQQDRGLTVREASLLQGFPASYWFSGSLDERFRQVGNAVPPTFASFLACHMLGQLVSLKAKGKSPLDQGISAPVGASFSRMIPGLKAQARISSAVGQ
jgi:DNA (cytosine-5)-methyltransferase 1